MNSKLFVYAVATFITLQSTIASAAFCKFIHARSEGETIFENFELDIRSDTKEVADCKSFAKENVEICWYQDGELKNLVFEKTDATRKIERRIISKYDVKRNPLPLQLDMSLEADDMYVVSCAQKLSDL